MSIAQYSVYFTPLDELNTYGESVEVTDFVLERSLGKIKQQIDAGDFDIGIYTFSDMTLTMANYDGRFNDETDSASMFYFARDRAKVLITYTDESSNVNNIYEGIINDQATTQDLEKEQVKFRILSRDSIFSKLKVAGGLINDGMSASTAIKALLNRSSITSLLGYDVSKISVGYDAIIDNAAPFSDDDSRGVLIKLLNFSGSVFYIDASGDMVVQDRSVLGIASLNLYGGGDRFQRDNILKIKNYNNGNQRAFNSFKINNVTISDDNFIDRFGLRKKNYNFGFITTLSTETAIAAYYVAEFKAPKKELQVVVKTEIVSDITILAPVVVDYVNRHKGFNGAKIPVAGATIAGQDVVPYSIGGAKILASTNWKVIGIEHDLKKLETTLRLREV